MDPKKNSVLTNATIVAAVITFCGTLSAAILGSPALAEYYREQKARQTEAALFPTETALLPSEIPSETPTLFPTWTPEPSPTPTIELSPTPTATGLLVPPTTPPLPDLIAVDISSPLCQTKRQSGPDLKYVRHTFTIRNIGPGSTAPFGPFSSRIVIIVEGQRYSLEQWAQDFNGLIEAPELNIQSLGLNDDAFITLGLDLRGNDRYALEVIANSGASVIPEANTTNNNRTQEFEMNCR